MHFFTQSLRNYVEQVEERLRAKIQLDPLMFRENTHYDRLTDTETDTGP